ncbi:LacI family DNA-binding transcriptional regulator [Paratractidigestivibacter sp.]|uniref:LacI family DNA-binding transcriptional regulator n=1 Tax=Paratractidigestivibacter sp. TaxID=2847316 RepID=UPI002ABD3D6B|nr:LacI family DNA-binding transcriptional regulator [Paratractidigestivibacter sp.]
MSSSRVTMKDIAAKVGVSVNTVHKAISNKPGVSDAVRAQIMQCAEEMGYRRNESASILRRRDLRVVVCLPSSEQEGSFYFAYLWRGIERYAAETRDHGMVFELRPFEIGSYQKVLSQVLAECEEGRVPDGVIAYAPVEDGTCELVTSIAEAGASLVLVDGDRPHTGRLGATVAAYAEAGNLMAEQAVNLLPGVRGAKKVLLLAGDPHTDSHADVARAFHAYFDERGLDYAVYDLHGAHAQVDELRTQLHSILAADDVPGLVCSVFAVGSEVTADTLMELGLAGKVSVIASDLFPENAEAMRRGVFTNIVYKDPVGIAYRGAQMLGNCLLKGEAPAQSVQRGSVELVFRSNLDQYCRLAGVEA